jgi:M6 family metalloprotease-like protein
MAVDLLSGKAARVVVFVLIIGLAGPALALEPPTPEQLQRYRMDGTLAMRIAQARAYGNHLMPEHMQDRLIRKVKSLSSSLKGEAVAPSTQIMAPPPGRRGMPTRGTVRILALLIDFSDYPGVTTPQTFASRLFGDGTGVLPYDSLRNFYLRSSYDQLTIEGNVLGWYTTPYARSTVTETTQGRQALIKEALDYYDQQGHDFAQYDNDGDGAIDYFCVFWAGPHGEWASFWWGYYTSYSDSTYRLDGKRLRSYSWQWELYSYPNGSFSSKTVIHETGHALGLPDYYDYDDDAGPRGGVGGLDIMDSSGDHNCFSKFMLDWIEPVVVSAGSRTLQLRGSGLFPDAVLFMPSAVPGQIFAEFFMVQNRHRTGNDTGLFTGSDGLVVWHVDSTLNSSGTNFLYNNSTSEHKLLKLVQADGLEQIETFDAAADAGDYYKAGMTLGPLTMPNTDRYDGTATGMGVTNITGTTNPMSLTVFSSDDLPVCGILSPAGGQTVYGTVPVDVSAGDDIGISRVELYAGGVLRSTLTAPPYAFSLDTTVLDNGTRPIEAVAYDTILQTASAAVSVVVDNLYAPANLKAERKVNRSLLLREYVDVLTWNDNSRNTSVVSFRVYVVNGAGRQLIDEVPVGAAGTTYRSFHRNVDPASACNYEIVSVGAAGRESPAGTITAR